MPPSADDDGSMGFRALVVLALLARIAAAETPAPEPVELRSPKIALMLSLGTTLAAGIPLAAGARNDNQALLGTAAAMFVVGPSVGHWYAGEWINGGFVTRVVGAGLAAWGAAQTDVLGTDGDSDDGEGLIVLGALVYVGGGIYEIATAPRAAREYNRANQPTVMIAPLVRENTGGLALAGQF